MSDKLTLARIKKFGQNFEISIDPDKALLYKKGELNDLNDVLQAEGIFTDAKKGLKATAETLARAFQTSDLNLIADKIIKEGEIQLNADHRAQEREKRRKQLIHFIHINAIDPKTNLPHPKTRIEAALEEAKAHLDDHKTVDEQIDTIIAKLRPIIPISIEKKKLTITIPSSHSGKAYNVVKSNSKTIKEDWLPNGSWKVVVELPAGLYFDLVDKLNSVTHGEVILEE